MKRMTMFMTYKEAGCDCSGFVMVLKTCFFFIITISFQSAVAKKGGEMNKMPVFLEPKKVMAVPLNQPPYTLVYSGNGNIDYCATNVSYYPKYGLYCADPGLFSKPNLKIINISQTGEIIRTIEVASMLNGIIDSVGGGACHGIFPIGDSNIVAIIALNGCYAEGHNFAFLDVDVIKNKHKLTNISSTMKDDYTPLFAMVRKEQNAFWFRKDSSNVSQYALIDSNGKEKLILPKNDKLKASLPDGSLIVLNDNKTFSCEYYTLSGEAKPLKYFGTFGCLGYRSEYLVPGQSCFFAVLLTNANGFKNNGKGMYQCDQQIQLCYYNDKMQSIFFFPCQSVLPNLSDDIGEFHDDPVPDFFEYIWFSGNVPEITIDTNGDVYIITLTGTKKPAFTVYKYEFNPKALELLPESIRPKQIDKSPSHATEPSAFHR
jgi:hypothetical protein